VGFNCDQESRSLLFLLEIVRLDVGMEAVLVLVAPWGVADEMHDNANEGGECDYQDERSCR
jgi:hypothetical protein